MTSSCTVWFPRIRCSAIQQGHFLSMLDPPDALRSLTAECRNEGTWPVLVGAEATRDTDTMLASPIILYDYPQLAPGESGRPLRRDGDRRDPHAPHPDARR